MTIELSVILGLLALLFIQQAFFMWQVHRLLNKAMSHNYAEYSQVENLKKKPVIHKVQLPDMNEFENVNALLR